VLTTPTPNSKWLLEFLAYKMKLISIQEIKDHKKYYDKGEIKKLAKECKLKLVDYKLFQLGLNSRAILEKIIKYFNVVALMLGLLIPLALFLNRFLIPDISFDSVNYHLYLGFKGVNWQNNQFEFYPTGIHNFSTILDVPGYVLSEVFGYRLGSIGSLIFLYLSIYVVYKIFRLYKPKFSFLDKWWSGLMFISMFFII